MRLDFFMLADSVKPPDGGHKITIEGAAITWLVGSELPVSVRNMASVARFVVDPEDASASADFAIRLRLLRPDGQQAGESEFLIVPPSVATERHVHAEEERGFFFVVDLSPVRFDVLGVHRFQLLINDEVVGERPLLVLLETSDAEEGTTSQA